MDYATQFKLNNGIGVKDAEENNPVEVHNGVQSKGDKSFRKSAEILPSRNIEVIKPQRYSDSCCCTKTNGNINVMDLKALQDGCVCFSKTIESNSRSCLFDHESRTENGNVEIETRFHDKELPSNDPLGDENCEISKGINSHSPDSGDSVELRKSCGRNPSSPVTDTRYISAAFDFLKTETESVNSNTNQVKNGDDESGQADIIEEVKKRNSVLMSSQRNSVSSDVSNLSSLSTISAVSSSGSISQTITNIEKDVSSDDSGLVASDCNHGNINHGNNVKQSQTNTENKLQPPGERNSMGKGDNLEDFSQTVSTKGDNLEDLSQTVSTKGDNLEDLSQTVSTKGDNLEDLSQTVSTKGDNLEDLSQTVSTKGDNLEDLSQTISSKGDNTCIVSTNEGDQNEMPAPGSEQATKPILRKRSSKRSNRSLKREDSCEQESDDSTDEDSGVYAESHRNSHWIKVEDDGTLTLPSMPYTIQEDEGSVEESNLTPASTSSETSNKDDDVFGDQTSGFSKTHKRTESSTTTASESEFRNKFRYLRKCSVQRQNSQQQFYRMSTKYYDNEVTITMEKDDKNTDFGIHILDSHPAVISAIIPGSTADSAGVTAGQILISVNSVNVLEANHQEIIKLIQQNPESLTLAVGESDVFHRRDLQAPVLSGYLTKMGSSGLIKLWRKRWFVLRQDNFLYYYKTENDKDPLGAVPLNNYSVSKALEVNKDFSFKLEKYGAKTFFFAAESEESRKRWANAMTAAAHSAMKTESWLDVTSHNVGIPALSIRYPECTGYVSKMGENRKNWKKRYCVLKDACIYYYKGIASFSAQGVAHLHGYKVDREPISGKRLSFRLTPPEKSMRVFSFATENDTDRERWMGALEKSIGRWQRISITN